MALNLAIDTLLRSYPEDVQILARQARKTLREWLPNADERADPSARMVGYGYGPGYKGMICTLILSKSGIKLGLVGGAALADPRGLLGGTGKVHRHVQLRTVRDLQHAGLKAAGAWRERGVPQTAGLPKRAKRRLSLDLPRPGGPCTGRLRDISLLCK
jgi:hypothetical protein